MQCIVIGTCRPTVNRETPHVKVVIRARYTSGTIHNTWNCALCKAKKLSRASSKVLPPLYPPPSTPYNYWPSYEGECVIGLIIILELSDVVECTSNAEHDLQWLSCVVWVIVAKLKTNLPRGMFVHFRPIVKPHMWKSWSVQGIRRDPHEQK